MERVTIVMEKYNCIIFDVDGTLVNTEKAIIYSLQKVLLEDTGKNYSASELQFVLGIPGSNALEKMGLANIEQLNQKWIEYMELYKDYVHLFSEIETVLSKIKSQKVTVGIVTSKTKYELDHEMTAYGLLDYMEYIVCADDTEKHKPEPEPLLRFLEISGVEPSSSIYIGDTIYDYKCAQSAGVDFGLAMWGAKNMDGINPKYKLTHPNEILQLI